MAGQGYLIEGNVTTAAVGRSIEDLRVVAYKPRSPSGFQMFGTCTVNSSGDFSLSFEYGTTGAPPLAIDIMPMPEVLSERFGVPRFEMSLLGLFHPKIHIPAGDWVMSGGVYNKTVSIHIPGYVWNIWDWLSEEFTVIGRVLKREDESLLPIPFAIVSATDADLPFPFRPGAGNAVTDEEGNFTITFLRLDFFIDYAQYYPTIKKYNIESWPDLVFHVVQVIGGTKTLIYREALDEARPKSMWDVPNRILCVTLETEEGITNDETYPPIPAGDNFLFHGIGLVDPHSIVDGYATTGPTDDLPNRTDCPFGSTLHIKGQFDITIPTPPRYYRVLYAKWDGATPPDPSDFTPILNESWTVSKYNTSTNDWEPQVIEPISGVIPDKKVYEIPDYTDITLTKKTRLIQWTTHRLDDGMRRYPDGKYDLLIEAWDDSGTEVDLNPSHPENNKLTVVIDNKRPNALLRRLGTFDILRTDEMQPYTPVCPVFSKGLGTLNVEFDAIDENDHFLKYHISFITGHNFYVDQTIKTYQEKVGANERFMVIKKHKQISTGIETITYPPDDIKLPGGFPGETITWDISSPDVVKCAYQVRLRVWDRTINGYGYIHYDEDTMHFSIEDP
jgi:hypothetical protein